MKRTRGYIFNSLMVLCLFVVGCDKPKPPATKFVLLKAELTDQLPMKLYRNFLAGMTFDGTAIVSGEKFLTRDPRWPSPNIELTRIQTPKGHRMVRLLCYAGAFREKFSNPDGELLLDRSLWIEDANNQRWFAVGVILLKANENLHIKADPMLLKHGADFPIEQMEHADQFYLYVPVPRGTDIKRLRIGNSSPDTGSRVWDEPLDLKSPDSAGSKETLPPNTDKAKTSSNPG